MKGLEITLRMSNGYNDTIHFAGYIFIAEVNNGRKLKNENQKFWLKN